MGGLYPGPYIPGAYNRGTYTGGLISGAFICVIYPGGFYPGGLRSTLIIFKDSTCFTRAERGHHLLQINDNHSFHKLLYFL